VVSVPEDNEQSERYAYTYTVRPTGASCADYPGWVAGGVGGQVEDNTGDELQQQCLGAQAP
jgi:hypothetical protein